ncbi:CgeB family protein [Psychromonas antarctica]|uniref:CgeB family protein n=1 Tax=Psychromonas antarctica TaxID=67573 RepID=UPI001EE8CA7F|nr:glycosyltransferase [Psychromonas antarctica]MCG6202760.1 glycosyltransferase [Psychromonas antarctica]
MITKILYIAFQYEYGKKENGSALNYKAWYENFSKLGYEVDALFYEDYTFEELQKTIITRASDISPDLIFFILQKDQVEINTLKKLKEKGFFTANFFGDDQWRFEGFTSNYSPYFSACITTDKYSIEKYYSIGQQNVIRSQWASLESQVEHVFIDYKYEVSFIGGYNRYRKWFVDALASRGIFVHCFGGGWDNGRLSYEQVEEVFSNSKINLNISNSESYDARYLLSSLRASLSCLKSVFKKAKCSSQTKARNFEIPVQGGFQLTDYVPSLDEYFDIGKEIACYNSIDEAEKLIKYYLKNDTERERIKSLGIRKARKVHTFKCRIVDFMKNLEEIKKNERD